MNNMIIRQRMLRRVKKLLKEMISNHLHSLENYK